MKEKENRLKSTRNILKAIESRYHNIHILTHRIAYVKVRTEREGKKKGKKIVKLSTFLYRFLILLLVITRMLFSFCFCKIIRKEWKNSCKKYTLQVLMAINLMRENEKVALIHEKIKKIHSFIAYMEDVVVFNIDLPTYRHVYALKRKIYAHKLHFLFSFRFFFLSFFIHPTWG